MTDPKDIERDIERTRAEMSETIEAIQERLSPGRLVDQLVWHLRSGGGRAVAEGAGEFASNLGRAIRENPVPVLLIGTGLAWLMFARSRRGDGYDEDLYSGDEGELLAAHYGSTEEAAERYDRRMRRIREAPIGSETDPALAGHYGTSAETYRPGAAGASPIAGRPDEPAADAARGRPQTTVEAVRASDPHAPFGRNTVGAAQVTPPGSGGQGQEASERARRAAEEARSRAAQASGGGDRVGHDEGGAHGARERVAQTAHEARERVGDWTASARDGARHTGEQIRHGLEEAQRSFGQGREYARRTGDVARRRAQRTGDTLSRMMRDQPLLVGALALAVGAALGALLPSTRREDAWLGGPSDDLRHRAYDEAARARRVAERTVEAARAEAERQGLSVEGAKEGLRAAQRAAEAKLREAQQAATETMRAAPHEVEQALRATAERKLQEGQEFVRETLKETEEGARATADEVQERVRKVGEAVREAAKEEAERQHLGESFRGGPAHDRGGDAKSGSGGSSGPASTKP